ncbi:MAG: carbohydrate kinase family protein [Lachnospiraceae bacterium]|nr:carbohydrate kinase family protein [Lachnospiraceae bacterium]
MKVLCIGSAVIDIAARPVGQEGLWKEKQRISDIQIQIGGDAANQSRHLAALGWEPALVSCIGADTNGRMLLAALESRGVDTGLVRVKEGCATGTAMVLVDEQGERHTFSVKGAHSLLNQEDLPPALPQECQAISLASLFSMPELEQDGLEAFLIRAKKEKKRIFADLASDKLGLGLQGIKAFLPYLDYFLPSLYDVQKMTGTETAEAAARVFRDHGTAHVIIKCGARGCYCDSDAFTGWIPALPVKPVDTTGAGDCMAAVFAARILAGDTMENACRYACAAGSYSTLFFGASTAELSEEKLEELMHQAP